MDKKNVVLTFSEWVERFRPVPNLLNQNAEMVGYARDVMGQPIDAGVLFDGGITGEEATFVRQVARDHPDRIWTFLNADALDPSAEVLDRHGFSRSGDTDTGSFECVTGALINEDGRVIDASNIQNGLHTEHRLGCLITDVPADPGCEYTILMDDGLAQAYRAEYDHNDPIETCSMVR